MDNRLKHIPKFNSEAEERAFWESPENDSAEYLDWSETGKAIFPTLKPATGYLAKIAHRPARIDQDPSH